MDRPWGLMVPRADTVTNVRIKQYLTKDVLQVANDYIFPTGDYEIAGWNGKRKREYDVSKPGEAKDPERSLEESKRRAKAKVKDIALCNRFTHMFTLTLNGELIDRYDATQVYKKLRAFLSNAVQRQDFRYVLIPEYHKQKEGEDKPAIHMHGLCSLGAVPIEAALSKDGTPLKDKAGRQIFNMTSWSWGFSACVELDADYEKAVSYVTKYITKAETKIFGKWYLSTRSLVKAPDIIPLECMNFEDFRDEDKILRNEQYEAVIYRDVRVVSEEFSRGLAG